MMSKAMRAAAAVLLAASVGACSLGSLLGGGGKVPPTLLTLTPEATETGPFTRSANAAQSVTIKTPTLSEELRTTRVAVQVGPTDVAYVKDVQMVDTPDRLMRELLAETTRRRTSRVVLDSSQVSLDPGLVVSGQLHRFGYDAQTGQAIVRYDASLATSGGTSVEVRRFEATAPADGTAATIGPALNRAANQVALDFAQWIAR